VGCVGAVCCVLDGADMGAEAGEGQRKGWGTRRTPPGHGVAHTFALCQSSRLQHGVLCGRQLISNTGRRAFPPTRPRLVIWISL
jgi:hypothetical protein